MLRKGADQSGTPSRHGNHRSSSRLTSGPKRANPAGIDAQNVPYNPLGLIGFKRVVLELVFERFQFFADQVALHPLVGPNLAGADERADLQSTAPIFPHRQPEQRVIDLATVRG